MSHAVLYKIMYPVEDSELSKPYYICKTQNSISKRMTKHLQNGTLKNNMKNSHRNFLTRSEIVKNFYWSKKVDNAKKQAWSMDKRNQVLIDRIRTFQTF